MAATTPTPISSARKAKTFTPPVLAIKPVDELPDRTTKSGGPSLTQRVADELAAAGLEAGQWYELLTYTSPQGASNAATRLGKQSTLDGYELAARNLVVYVRLAG